MMEKLYINESDLIEDSFRLGVKVFESGFKPDFIVGVWRGGSTVGIYVQECLQYLGVKTDHIAIRTSYQGLPSYQAMIDEQTIKVHGLKYLLENLNRDDKLLIVDEPTAGLDPEERNRFHNLLSDISENTVVILSTHIVEDVSNLCPNMAIQAQGEIIATGAPSSLISTISSTLWKTTISKSQLAEYKNKYSVISHRLVAGNVQIHVISNHCPAAEFSPIPPDLEDVYFHLLAEQEKRSHTEKTSVTQTSEV
mgnify:CR=1 FL=1